MFRTNKEYKSITDAVIALRMLSDEVIGSCAGLCIFNKNII